MDFDFRSKMQYIWQDKKRFSFSLIALILIILIFFGLFRSCSTSEKKGKSTYHIARDLNWAPLSLMGKERNMRAFSDELLFAIANKAHLRISLLAVNYGYLLEGLDAGKYDGILSVLTPNVVNQTHYLFSDPFYLLGPVLVVQENSPINSLDQMEGKIVGIKNGSSSVYNVEHFPSILILTYDNMILALEDLVNNKVDGVIMDAWPAHVNVQGNYKGKLKIVTPPFTKEGLRLVTLREPEYAHLVESFNEGLEELKKDGVYDELLKSWDLFNTDIKPTVAK